jgi:hypothetical protein
MTSVNDRLTLRPQLPPLRELESYRQRIAEEGARPLPQVDLQTTLPHIGPYTLGHGGYYDLQVYPGPLIKVVAAPSTGQKLDVSA